ncbi:MAG: methyltransferase domain-containing protein [Parvularculales bacterium]
MIVEAATLRDFYASPQGQETQRLIGVRIINLWPPTPKLSMAGIGYALPWLEDYTSTVTHTLALMPAKQGALIWPPSGQRRTSLITDMQLPLPDECLDRILIIHALEVSQDAPVLLRQIWRTLKPGGKALVIVPNRRGLWGHLSSTPFSAGYTFSHNELANLLINAMLTPEVWDTALHVPPALSWRMPSRMTQRWEWCGRHITPGLAGVFIVEASKQLYAPLKLHLKPVSAHTSPQKAAALRLIPAPEQTTLAVPAY